LLVSSRTLDYTEDIRGSPPSNTEPMSLGPPGIPHGAWHVDALVKLSVCCKQPINVIEM